MQFNHPIWLLGLTGILVPLAIHLLSRKEGKLIRIGSLRHLEETSTRQFKSIKLNEILLLILRSFLIVWLSLLLCSMYLSSSASGPGWLLIEKGLENDPGVKQLSDSLNRQHYEVRALSDGFPIVKDSIAAGTNNYFRLIEELNNSKSHGDVVIVSASRMNAFNGEAITLPANVRWITKELAGSEQVISSRSAGDSIWIRRGKFTSTQTEFSSSIEPRPQHQAGTPSSIKIRIIRDPEFDYDARIIQASLKTIDEIVPEKLEIVIDDDDSNAVADLLIILSNSKHPDGQIKSITYKPKLSDQLLIRETRDQWTLTQRLDPDNAIAGQLTMSLALILFPRKDDWKKALPFDVRVAGDNTIKHATANGGAGSQKAPLDQLLIILFAVTLVAERWISLNRNQ